MPKGGSHATNTRLIGSKPLTIQTIEDESNPAQEKSMSHPAKSKSTVDFKAK
jgi:hypothetical protein